MQLTDEEAEALLESKLSSEEFDKIIDAKPTPDATPNIMVDGNPIVDDMTLGGEHADSSGD
jgi:hypothetical protein